MLTGVPFWSKVPVTRTKPGVAISTLPSGASIDATLISFLALRFTVEVRSTLTTGLTFIFPIAISFPAKIPTLSEALILPVLTVPLVLVASTPTPPKSCAFILPEAVKLTFPVVASVLPPILILPEVLFTSTPTPRKSPEFTFPEAVKFTLFSVAVAGPISILPEVLFTLTLVPSKFPELTFSEAMTLIFPSDVVLPIAIVPRGLLTITVPPCKLPAFKSLDALKAIVPVPASIDTTLILVWASRFTVGIRLTGFVAAGLTVIIPVLISCWAKIITSPVVLIAPVATLPVLLLALTLAALRLPTVKSLEAVKLIFSLAVILTGAVLKTILFGSLKTPSSPEILTISTLDPCKFPKFTSPKALSAIAPEIPVSIDLVSILPPPLFRLILPLISAREMSFVNIILLRA